MKRLRRLVRQDRVCPWWLSYTFDNPLRRYVHDPAEILGPFVREGMTVADIGCGRGYFSLALAELVGERGRVFAVDLQQRMLDLMLRRAGRAGVADRIQPVLSLPDDLVVQERLDLALCFWMVHEVQDPARFFSQLHGLLREGGIVVYAEPRMHVPTRRFDELVAVARQQGFAVAAGPAVRLSRAALLTRTAPDR